MKTKSALASENKKGKLLCLNPISISFEMKKEKPAHRHTHKRGINGKSNRHSRISLKMFFVCGKRKEKNKHVKNLGTKKQ